MTTRNFSPVRAIGLLLPGFLLAATLSAQTQGVSAGGFGVRVTKAVGSVSPVASAALTGGRNLDGTSVPGVSVPGTVTTGLLTTISTGARDPEVSGAQTTATVARVDLLNGLITADQLVASASSTVSEGTARSSGEGSSVEGLRVAGVSYGDALPPPNTRVTLPGVGYVILNEQVVTGNGTSSTGITVNLVRVVLSTGSTGLKNGEIILGSASSSVR